MLRVNCVQKKNVYNCHGRTSLTNPTCSLSGLFKVFHQSREQHTKAESHTKVDWVTNRSWNTHDPWPRAILETLSGETLLVVLLFNHFVSHRYRPDVSVEWHDQWKSNQRRRKQNTDSSLICITPSICGLLQHRIPLSVMTGLWLRFPLGHKGSNDYDFASYEDILWARQDSNALVGLHYYGIAEKPATRSSSCVGIKMMSVL